MSEDFDTYEVKQVKYVWILNAIPPGSGIGAIYGCGSLAIILVLGLWMYIYANFSLESVLVAYVVQSTLGTIGCFIHNMGLHKNEAELREEAWLESELSLGMESSTVISSEVVQSKFDTNKGYDQEEFEQVELDSHSDKHTLDLDSQDIHTNIETVSYSVPDLGNAVLVDNNTFEKLANPSSTFIDSPETDSLNSEEDNDAEQIIPLDNQRPKKLDQPESGTKSIGKELEEIEKKPTSEETQLVQERSKFLKKLGKATGEIQLEEDSLDLFDPEKFSASTSQFDFSFASEIEKNFEPGFSKDLLETEHESNCIRCDCGEKVNESFSFCLTCGKSLA